MSAQLHFVIGGAQKSGTCTLDAIFRLHPQIQMARIKETHFFDDETRDWTAPDYRELDAFFDSDDGRFRGDATPITLYWRPAIERLHAYNPDTKIILLLRDPVARAFSNWQQQFAYGRERLTFAQAIREGRRRLDGEPATGDLRRFFAYVERGMYGEQLTYLCKYFPKTSIHCEISEEFFADRAAGLRRIARFLNIDGFAAHVPDIHLNPARSRPYPSALTERDARYLSGLFSDQVACVEEFLGRPIPNWVRP